MSQAVNTLTGRECCMSKEPEIFCPQCGSKAFVVIWFSDEPGEGLGSANCPRCGGIDFRIRYNRVVESALADPAEFEECEEDLLSREEYDRELMEYMMEQNLI